MEHSESLKELAPALNKAQKVVKHAIKGSNNPYFKSRYADLTQVMECCKDALNSNGITVVQSPYTSADRATGITTMLLHTSGEWLKGSLALLPTKNDPQGQGSAITYARRYALAAMVGVTPVDEDDDGNAASQARPVQRQVSTQTPRRQGGQL